MIGCVRAVSINTPLPTKPPTSAPTQTPAPTESPTASYGEQFTNDYLAKFENIREGTKDVAGENKKVIFGIDVKTKKEQVIGMEMDGQMVRMGEWIDSEGRSFYAYIPNGFDIGQRIGVISKTPEILLGTENKPLSVNLFKSIGEQWGMIPEEAKAKIFADGGIANFQVPTAPEVGSELAKDDYAVVWTDLPYPANFNLPIEIITIESFERFESLDVELKNIIVTDKKYLRESEVLNGRLLWVKPNGQIQIIAVASGISSTTWVLNPKPSEEKYVTEFIRKSSSWKILETINLIGKLSDGKVAFKNSMTFNQGQFDNISRNFVDYSLKVATSSQ